MTARGLVGTVCTTCGSDSLFSGWFDADDLACPLGMDEATPPGVRWTTFCNDCGAENTGAPRKWKRERSPGGHKISTFSDSRGKVYVARLRDSYEWGIVTADGDLHVRAESPVSFALAKNQALRLLGPL